MIGKKSIVLIIMDGLGDRPSPILGGRTPMDSSYMPNMNRMARKSIGGLMHPFKKGIVCGSDTSHLSILGYDPEKYYTGRGPFEALGLGMKVEPGDIAFRANYATRDGNIIKDRRAGRIRDSTSSLSRDISFKVDDVQIEVASGVEHRAALLMKGSGLSDKIKDTDPHEVGKVYEQPEFTEEEGRKTSYILKNYMEKARKILENHSFNQNLLRNGHLPANELLLRGAGRAPMLENFGKKYGLNAGYIIGIPMIRGLAEMVGMEKIKVSGMTGSTDTNYRGKIEAVANNMGKYDFILVNIKATDVAAHDKNPVLKREVMEKIDEAMELLVELKDRALFILTGDHSTSSTSGEHTGDPVPILFYTSGINTLPAESFTERSCGKTGFTLRGLNVMDYALQLTERLEKYGA